MRLPSYEPRQLAPRFRALSEQDLDDVWRLRRRSGARQRALTAPIRVSCWWGLCCRRWAAIRGISQPWPRILKGAAGFQLTLINTSRGDNHGSPLHNFWVGARTLMAIAAGLFRADILSFHASDRGMVTFGQLIQLYAARRGSADDLSRLWRLVRRFLRAGRLDHAVRSSASSFCPLTWSLLQTQRLIQQLSPAALRGAS